ncbi:hypothetical protein AC578_10036 [Pseudocercospora eumusae]|uniref:Uncharacterized protein n=1 Tax=Pseudocercospora eumusae TaxID=321146 RepID=A0A139H6J5_9PEZI|nr:hypothetical protein AC578_10036 [Pseudocercospora eumusae]
MEKNPQTINAAMGIPNNNAGTALSRSLRNYLDSSMLYLLPTPQTYNKYQSTPIARRIHRGTAFKLCNSCSRSCPPNHFDRHGKELKTCARCRRTARWNKARKTSGKLKAWCQEYPLPIVVVLVVLVVLGFVFMRTSRMPEGREVPQQQPAAATTRPPTRTEQLDRKTTEIEWVVYETVTRDGFAHIGSSTHTVTKFLIE